MKNLRYTTFLLLFPVLLLTLSCEDTTSETADPARGDLLSSSLILSANGEWLTATAGEENIPPFAVFDYAVKTVRLEYYTEGKDGELVLASGALCLPLDPVTFEYADGSFPMLSLQHGTQYYRESVASVFILNSPEGLLGMLGAMGGYVTAIPDYIGFGQSDEMHPYIISEYTANAVVDMIRAAREYCRQEGLELDGQVMLAGYSEGGYATMAAHKAIETDYSDEITVEASAPMAGPFDMVSTADFILNSGNYASSAIMGFILTAYNHYYDLDMLSTFFQDPYAGQVNDIFSGDHNIDYINQALPSNMMDYLDSDFVAAYLAGNYPDLVNIFEENSLLDWTPEAPVLLIHGDSDEIVPYLNAVTAYNDFSAKGCDVTLITIPGGMHGTSAWPAIIEGFDYLMGLIGK